MLSKSKQPMYNSECIFFASCGWPKQIYTCRQRMETPKYFCTKNKDSLALLVGISVLIQTGG